MGSRSDSTFVTAVHGADQGKGRVVESARGGYLDFTDGAGLQVSGVDVTAAVATAVAGTVAGTKTASGTVTLDGSNPTPIATGLTAVTSVEFTLLSTAAPGIDPLMFTADFGNLLGNGLAAGLVNLYAWKATSNANPTLIASTNSTAIVAWVAYGT